MSPDLGNAKSASAFARRLGAPVAAGARQRFDDDEVRITSIIGDVSGKDALVLDDEVAKGSTVFELLARLRERGGKSIRVACTHGLCQRLARASAGTTGRARDRLYEHRADPAEKRVPKLTVLSIASALAEAMRRIHGGESVSALFADR